MHREHRHHSSTLAIWVMVLLIYAYVRAYITKSIEDDAEIVAVLASRCERDAQAVCTLIGIAHGLPANSW
jgi:hypothetical protein